MKHEQSQCAVLVEQNTKASVVHHHPVCGLFMTYLQSQKYEKSNNIAQTEG